MSAFPGSQVPARREAGQELRPKPLSNLQTLQPDRMGRDQREGNGRPAHSKIYVSKIMFLNIYKVKRKLDLRYNYVKLQDRGCRRSIVGCSNVIGGSKFEVGQ